MKNLNYMSQNITCFSAFAIIGSLSLYKYISLSQNYKKLSLDLDLEKIKVLHIGEIYADSLDCNKRLWYFAERDGVAAELDRAIKDGTYDCQIELHPINKKDTLVSFYIETNEDLLCVEIRVQIFPDIQDKLRKGDRMIDDIKIEELKDDTVMSMGGLYQRRTFTKEMYEDDRYKSQFKKHYHYFVNKTCDILYQHLKEEKYLRHGYTYNLAGEVTNTRGFTYTDGLKYGHK